MSLDIPLFSHYLFYILFRFCTFNNHYPLPFLERISSYFFYISQVFFTKHIYYIGNIHIHVNDVGLLVSFDNVFIYRHFRILEGQRNLSPRASIFFANFCRFSITMGIPKSFKYLFYSTNLLKSDYIKY